MSYHLCTRPGCVALVSNIGAYDVDGLLLWSWDEGKQEPMAAWLFLCSLWMLSRCKGTSTNIEVLMTFLALVLVPRLLP